MRDLDQAVLDVLDTDNVRMAILFQGDFDSGTVYLWAGPEGHALDYDGQTWVSVGEIGEIDRLAESQGLTDARTTVSLRLNSENIDVIDVEDSRGNDAITRLLIFDEDGNHAGDVAFRSTMGPVRIRATASREEGGRTVIEERLSLELLSETASLDQTHFLRNTYEAGLRIDDTDHGLEFVAHPDIGIVPGVRLIRGEPGGPPLRRFEQLR